MTTYEQFGFSYIGSINSSAKIQKGKKYGIDTYILYLAPSTLSGHNVCALATDECKIGCLNTSGRAKMPKLYDRIMGARIKKTQLFYSDRVTFMAQMVKEITMFRNRAKRKNRIFSVRINGTSDLSPEIFKHNGKNLLELFPDVTFYDYTKIPNRYLLTEKYSNYKITFSYTGSNWIPAEEILTRGANVAVIFDVIKGHALPEYFNGYRVVDGDITDYRPLDEEGVIIGLRWKNIKDRVANARIKNSQFVQPRVQLQMAA